MRDRKLWILVGGATAVVMAGAIAAAALPGSSERTAFDAAGAGTVVVEESGDGLSIVDVETASGFTAEVERGDGAEVEVEFRSSGTEVDFSAEREDGEIRIRVRTETRAEDATGNTVRVSERTESTVAAGSSTSTTIDDDDDDDHGTTSTTIDDDDDHGTTSTTIDD